MSALGDAIKAAWDLSDLYDSADQEQARIDLAEGIASPVLDEIASGGGGVTLSDDNPEAAGAADPGNGGEASRSDHVHPAQTSVSGNAGTATALQTARNIAGVSFNGTADIAITTATVADSANKRYVTDAQLTVIGNTSGTNTGDAPITVKDEGSNLHTAVTSIDFVGAGVVATNPSGSAITVTIAGGAATTMSAAVGSAPNDAGGAINTNVLTLQPASSTKPGVWAASGVAQSLGGDRNFTGRPNFSGGTSSTYCFKVDKDHLTTFGGPSALIGGNDFSGTNQVYTLGYGYATSTSKPAVEVGAKDTDTAGFHKAAFVIATRDVTTDTAPTEQVRVNPDGKVGVGRTATTNLLEVEGAIESKSGGFVFPDATTQTTASVGGAALAIKDEGGTLHAAATSIDFVGAGVTATNTGAAITVTVPGGSGLEVLDEGVTEHAGATSIDFVGAGVSLSSSGSDITVNIAGGSSGWSLATPPASPHADDCEFDEASIAAGGWTEGGTSVGTAINPYANFSTAANWRHSYNDRRPGWLMIQPTADATTIWPISKTVTIGANHLAWARLSYATRASATVTGNDHSIALALTASSGGAVDGNNYVALFLSETDTNEYAVQFQKSVAGVITTTEYIVALTAEKLSFSFVAIQKISSDFHFWVAPENGNWMWLGTLNYAGATVDRVAIQTTNANTAAPGNMVVGVDFIRHSATADFLP